MNLMATTNPSRPKRPKEDEVILVMHPRKMGREVRAVVEDPNVRGVQVSLIGETDVAIVIPDGQWRAVSKPTRRTR